MGMTYGAFSLGRSFMLQAMVIFIGIMMLESPDSSGQSTNEKGVEASPSNAKEPVPAQPFIGGNVVFGLAHASKSPLVLAGVSFNGGGIFAAGLEFKFDGNGFEEFSGKKFFLSLALHGAYMVYNKHPWATGPELTLTGAVLPDKPFQSGTITPGWAFWYGAFNAPVALGAAWGVGINLRKDAKPAIDLFTAGIRFAFAFSKPRPPKRKKSR